MRSRVTLLVLAAAGIGGVVLLAVWQLNYGGNSPPPTPPPTAAGSPPPAEPLPPEEVQPATRPVERPKGPPERPVPLYRIGGEGAASFLVARFHASGKRVITVDGRRNVREWGLATGEWLSLHPRKSAWTSYYPRDVDPLGTLVTGEHNDNILLFEVKTGEHLFWHLLGADLVEESGYPVSGYAFSPDGRFVAVRHRSPGGGVQVLDLIARKRVSAFGKGDESIAHRVTFSGDGKRVFTHGWGRAVHVWDAATGKALATLRGVEVGDSKDDPFDKARYGYTAVSPDGKLMASNWDPGMPGPTEKELPSLDETARKLAAAPGDMGYVGERYGHERVAIRDTATGKVVRVVTMPAPHLADLSFSPDGRVLVTDTGNQTVFWEVSSGEPLATMYDVYRGTFKGMSPDGRYVLTVRDEFRPDPNHPVGYDSVSKGEVCVWELAKVREPPRRW